MKKSLLASTLLATIVLGNVAMAAETDIITEGKNIATSTNKIKVTPGEAEITAAPSYEFEAITASDVAAGEVKGKTLASTSPKDQKLSFKNDTLKNITLTVSVTNSGVQDFLTGFTMHYGAGTDEPALKGNEVATEAFDLNPEASAVIVKDNAQVGQHDLTLENPTADFTFDKAKINDSKTEYTQEILWKLTDGTEGQEKTNTL